MTASRSLHSDYDAQGVVLQRVLQRVLTDNGREYCGRPLHHPFELYCTVQQLEHRTTKVGSPETNGIVERFHRTLKDEFFSLAYRRKIYTSVEELQADLDAFVAFYNAERAHHGYRTQGRTPLQTFHDHQQDLAREEVAPVAA